MRAKVDRIGDYVVSGDPGSRDQAEVARQYVLALRAYEDGGDLSGAVGQVARLIDSRGTERDDRIL